VICAEWKRKWCQRNYSRWAIMQPAKRCGSFNGTTGNEYSGFNRISISLQEVSRSSIIYLLKDLPLLRKPILQYTSYAVFGLLTFLAVAATVVPLLPSKEWYVRIFDYPRLQTFFIALFALAGYAVVYFRRKKKNHVFILLYLAVMLVQGYRAWPYTPLAPKQVRWSEGKHNDSASIRFFICNVLQTNTAYAAVMERVAAYQPDIMITTETDSTWQNRLQPLEKRFPYRIAVPQSNTYGMHLYSRLPLRESTVRYLVEPDIPSMRTGVQLANGQWITLFVVHPRPPVPTEASDSRERDAEIILVAREARKEKGGVIVAGDFNDVAWSETTALFQEVSGFLDPRRGRGFYNTFHAKVPIFRWPLDHIFHSRHFTLNEIERTGPVNSDHFPMYVSLQYNPDEKEKQPAVAPDRDTEKKAAETIKKGKTDTDSPGE
jgi:endonuclease/exonuclease/phosphatase (EEP) superfamily protein YafD